VGSKIEKGASRVGMEGCIVGRQAITWQYPECILENTDINDGYCYMIYILIYTSCDMKETLTKIAKNLNESEISVEE